MSQQPELGFLRMQSSRPEQHCPLIAVLPEHSATNAIMCFFFARTGQGAPLRTSVLTPH